MDVFETVPNTVEITDQVNQNDPLEDVIANGSIDGKLKINLNNVVVTVLEHLKNANEIVVGIPEGLSSYKTKSVIRKPRPGETEEQQEIRLMKQRIFQMKTRLLLQLQVPNKAQAEKERATKRARAMRAKRKVTETPEEAAARKRRQRAIVAASRKRLRELETPEQQAERIAKQNERKKLKTQEMTAKETPEQRAARKKREQSYREKYKRHKLAIKTGKIRGRTLE